MNFTDFLGLGFGFNVFEALQSCDFIIDGRFCEGDLDSINFIAETDLKALGFSSYDFIV